MQQDLGSRRASLLGGREWLRLSAVKLVHDCLRRRLYGLPLFEQIGLEKT